MLWGPRSLRRFASNGNAPAAAEGLAVGGSAGSARGVGVLSFSFGRWFWFYRLKKTGMEKGQFAGREVRDLLLFSFDCGLIL